MDDQGLPADVPAAVEHTVLGPTTTTGDVRAVLDEARDLGTRACVPSCHVATAADHAPDVAVTAVVGFPHGQHVTEAKCAEAEAAWAAGAAELDVVANLGALLDGDDEAVVADLEEVIATVPVPVKVIVEAPLLEEGALRRACEAAVAAGADFLKTATGLEGGATVEDVSLLAEYRPVKASGGIGSWDRARALFAAGAERIGASSGATIVREYREANGDGTPTHSAAGPDSGGNCADY